MMCECQAYRVNHLVHYVLLEGSHYYPFGLTVQLDQAGQNNLPDQPIKFQGQRHDNDLGINIYSFKYREHDPTIGRFWQVDPLAADYVHNSPYAFSENKVTSHVELEGLEAIPYLQGLEMAATTERGAEAAISVTARTGTGVQMQAHETFVELVERKKGDMAEMVLNTAIEVAPIVKKAVDRAIDKMSEAIDDAKEAVTKTSDKSESEKESSETTKRSSNKLKPDPDAGGDHTSFLRDKNGKIYKYETYEKTGSGHNNPVKRYDGGQHDGRAGASHKGVPTPHVQGKTIPARPAKSNEIPLK